MRALITGGGGQLAEELLLAAGEHEAVAFPIERLDICDDAQVRAALTRVKPNIVFNAAAYTAVDLAQTHADLAERINHHAVRVLASACTEFGARLVQVSTDYVFDGRSGVPYVSTDATNPQSVYGTTKRAGELAALQSRDALVVRTAWLYSTRGTNFMRTMIRLMQERDELRVVSDQIGTPTHAAGLARAMWDLALTGATGVHHWTDAGVASWYEFALAIRDESAAAGFATANTNVLPIASIDYPTAAPRPAMSVLCKAATWSALGRTSLHWREGLHDTMIEYARICAEKPTR